MVVALLVPIVKNNLKINYKHLKFKTMGIIGVIFIIVGGLLIYFGMKFNIASGVKTIKDLGDQEPNKLLATGCRGYVKVMMILSGVGFIIIGLVWSCAGSMMSS